jgi:hypothetical protein
MADVPQATVVSGPSTPGYGHRLDQFGDAHFVEQEFWISGLARKYKGSGTLGGDGKWCVKVASDANPYDHHDGRAPSC